MMGRGPTSAAPPRSLRAVGVSLLVAATLSAALAASGGAAGTSSATVGTPDTATLVGTVDVADLPAPTTTQGSVLPLLVRDPAAFAAAKAAANAPPADLAEGSFSPNAPTLTPGTKLTGAIDGSNCGCTPPDMGLAVAHGYKMEQVNLAGRVWDPNNNPGNIFGLSGFYKTGSDAISDPWIVYNG